MWDTLINFTAELARSDSLLYGIFVVASMAVLGALLGGIGEGIFWVLGIKPSEMQDTKAAQGIDQQGDEPS